MIIIMGKIVAEIIPVLSDACSASSENLDAKLIIASFVWAKSLTLPAINGPKEQPISPQRARILNIVAPEFGNLFDAKVKVPGHIQLTENPQIAHANRDIYGFKETEVTI